MASSTNRGRPRKPVEIKKAAGTYRKDREPEDSFVPEILQEMPKPPTILMKTGKKIWRETGRQLVNAGVLGFADLDLFSHYCYLHDLCYESQKSIKIDGLNIRMENKGGGTYVRKNPAIETYANSVKEIRQIASHFGITPASRAKVPRSKTDDSNNTWEGKANNLKVPQLRVS